MKKLPLVLALILNFLILTPIYSQIDLKLIIRNPTPSDIYEWQQDPTIVQLIVNNLSTNDYQDATFGFKITNEDGVIIAESKYNSPSAPKFYIPTLVTSINGPQIIDVNSISFNRDALISNSTNLMSSFVLPTSIPEGFYEICISIYDQRGNNITNFEEYCTNFTVLIPDPPVLVSPMDDEFLMSPFPNFIWIPVTNYSTGVNQLRYKLKICPVYEGQSPRTAIDQNPILLEKNDIITTQYIYLPSDLPFDYFKDVERFVWMVQAFDQDGVPATKNQGRSELGTFRIEKKIEPTIYFSNEYPVDKDTIPWNMPHLVNKFTPYTDDVISVRLNLTVRKYGTKDEYTNTRTLNFVGGAKSSQQLNTDDEASIIIANLDDNRAFPVWMPFLEKGVKYNWTVEAEFTKTDGSLEKVTTSETSFVIGFKKLKNTYPSKDSVLVVGKKFDCSFQIPRTENLNFDNVAILNNPSFQGYNSFSNASGKFSIEIAKKESFDSIVQTKNFILPENGEIKTGNNCDELFNKITKEFDAVKDTGKYYYRVNYLNNADQKYYSSPAKSIKLVSDSLYTCFEMQVESPVNNGKWTESKKPKFSVSIKPEIKKSAITGGHIKVWKKTSSTQTNENAKKAKAVLDTTFTGNDNKKIFAYSTDMNGFTRYDLNFINGDSISKTFTADTAATYLWNFKMTYKKDSIRTDKELCDSNAVTSNDGIFKVEEAAKADSNSCPGDCITELPSNKTPGTQSLKKDSTITFGKFKLKLGTVTGTPGFLSGDGSIEVKYLRAPIIVEFNGLKVNSDNKVYEGEAYAKIDEAIEYSKSDAEGYEGKALNFVEGAAKFKEIHDYSVSTGKLVSSLIGTTPVTLPIGFDRDYDGYKVIVGIIGMTFTPVKGTLDAAMYVEMPSLGPDVGLGFGAKDICFHKDGIAGKEKGMLYLAQDFGYDNDESWSLLLKAPTPTDSGTYASWDCNGFNEMVIAAEVEFPRSWMKPTPDPDPTKMVKAHFKTKAEKSGAGWQWMASANLDECELSGAEGYKMKVQEMVFDYSTAKNPEGIKFPKKYSGTKTNLWKGFYIKRATIAFPDKIKTFDDLSPILSINNVIIDGSGITAGIWGENVFQDKPGDFGGLVYSLDTIKIDLVSSSLQSGEMKGQIRFSIMDTSLQYTGLLAQSSSDSKLSYQLKVEPIDSLDIDCWKSELRLDPTSRIEMSNSTGKFLAEAVLDGKLTLEGDPGGVSKIGFKGIKFEKLKFLSKSPYVALKDYKLASPQHSIAGFPVSIDSIKMVTRSGSGIGGFGVGLQFDMAVTLKSGADAISGKTKLSVWADIEDGLIEPQFSFGGVELNAVTVEATMPSVYIKGSLSLFDSDPVYGDGFRGAVTASFVDKVSVMATAQFGSVNNYQYWYVDAKAIFPTAVPILSGLGMYGFGGGAWYHMSKSGSTDLSTSSSEPDSSKNARTTNSGYRYVPNQSVDLGLKASMVIGTHPSAEAFNGDVGLEAQFLSGGGLGTVSLVGNGFMMCKITERNKAKVEAIMDLTYNVPTETFHGTFDVEIKASPLDGGGQMVMHVDPKLWYMKVGEPTNPIDLSLAGWLQAQSYLMIGQGLPSPSVPTEIQNLFPGQVQDRKSAIALGNGFAFGANTSFETGRKEYMGFYGELSALAGFDMSLLNYSDGARCEGMDDPMGINGWYAYGQIYSYVSASIGLHVDLYFTEGNYEILNMQAGAILNGGGPNPTWLKGNVGGDYRILGGKVKGHCNFHFSMGDQCEMIQENPLSRINLITDISPVSGTEDVEVMIEPQVASNFELNEPFDLLEMPEGEESPTLRTFQVKLKDFNLRKTSNDDSIAGIINYAPDKFSAYYSSHDMLPGQSNFSLAVSAYGEEYINEIWTPAVKNDGSLITQTESTNFKTGDLPEKIREQDVAYTYPVNKQNYFLQDECRSGQVQLKTGMNYLFIPSINNDTELIARFVPIEEGVEPVEVPFTYNSSSKSLRFDIPNLQNTTEYYVQFLKKTTVQEPEERGTRNRRTSNTSEEESANSDYKSGEVIISENKLVEKRVRTKEKILYAISFKTSQYNTLEAKLNSFNYITTDSEFSENHIEVHKAAYEGEESFGRLDLNPTTWIKSGTTHTFGPLLKTNGDFQRTSTWHNTFANPLVYDKIQWMIQKGWWYMHVDGYGITEYLRYSSNKTSKRLVDIEANGYYTPIPEESESVMEANRNVYSATAQTGKATTQTGRAATQTSRATAQTSIETTQTSAATTQTSGASAQMGVATVQTNAATAQTSGTSAQVSGVYSYTAMTTSSSGTTAQTTGTTTQTSGAYSNSAATSLSSGTYSGLSGSGFSPGNIGGATFDELQSLTWLTLTPNIILTYNHGKVTAIDFLTLRNEALSRLSSQYVSKTAYDISILHSILNTNYQSMPKGNYPLKFYYNYFGCQDVDAQTPMIDKPFIY